MSEALPLLARLGEAASFPKAVREYESDPWSYFARKLDACEPPLRAYKKALYDQAVAALLRDLQEPFLKPAAVLDHKETFEKLLPLSDFADLCFNLESPDPDSRRENVASIVKAASPKTLFDVEALPPERRGKPWEALVAETSKRLDVDRLLQILGRQPRTDFRRAMVLRRLRRNLQEHLAVARGEMGLREEITLFLLTRIEAAIAASRRFLRSR